jgi:hypothetical protein
MTTMTRAAKVGDFIRGGENMTPDEFKARMEEVLLVGSCEYRHEDADDLMCEVLRSLGYGDGVDIFEKMEKWYA